MMKKTNLILAMALLAWVGLPAHADGNHTANDTENLSDGLTAAKLADLDDTFEIVYDAFNTMNSETCGCTAKKVKKYWPDDKCECSADCPGQVAKCQCGVKDGEAQCDCYCVNPPGIL